jgi:hypothetical protein
MVTLKALPTADLLTILTAQKFLTCASISIIAEI